VDNRFFLCTARWMQCV